MSYNADLKKRIAGWQADATAAKTKQQVLDVTQSIVDFGQPLKFRLTPLHVFGWLFAGAGALMTYLWLGEHSGYTRWATTVARTMDTDRGFILAGIPISLIVVAAWLFIVIGQHRTLIRQLCVLIVDRATLCEYNLKRTNTDYVNGLLEVFGDMHRGNHERGIYDCLEGEFAGDNHTFQYHPYRLHYVDRNERQTYDSTRKEWVTEVTYDEYDRSGIIFDFPMKGGIHICREYETTLYGAPYKASFAAFNDLFYCRGSDAMVVSRFLKPAVEEVLVKAASGIPGLCVEINEDGKLCLSSSKSHVVNSRLDVTNNAETSPIVSPQGFHNFVQSGHRMEVLDNMLELADMLMRYSDSNFSRKTVNS